MTEIEYSSPACAIRQADDAYMGYAGRDELIEALRRLLSVTEEAPWRAMLARHLVALGAAADAAAAPDEGAIGLLRRLLPRVRDDRLHADLSAMLRVLEGSGAAGGPG